MSKEIKINVQVEENEQPIIIQTPEYFAPVQSVNGKIGFVTITQEDLGIGNGLATSGDLLNYSGYVENKYSNVVYTTGDQTVNGAKQFIGFPLRFGNSSRIDVDEEFLRIRGTNGNEVLSTEEYLLFDANNKASVGFDSRILYNSNNFNNQVLDWSGPYLQFFGNMPPTFNGTGLALVGVYNITYSQLLNLKKSGQLNPGGIYRISDFILKWRIDSVNIDQVLSGSGIEPLYVSAYSTNKLGNIAYSELYPNDIIYYDIDATGCKTWGQNSHKSIPDFKGWIYRRINTTKNIDIPWDWRNIKVNCCKLNLSGIDNFNINNEYYEKDLVRYQNNLYFLISGDSQNIYPDQNSIAWKRLLPPFFGFNDTDIYIPTNEIGSLKVLYDEGNENYYKYSIPYDSSTRKQFLTFITDFNNTGLNLNFVNDIYIKYGVSNLFVNEFNGGFINNHINSLSYNLINRVFINNNLDSLDNNIIGLGFSYNESSKPMSNNIFIGNCSENIFDGSLTYNYFGNNFRSNEMFGELMANIIGDNTTNNIIKPEGSFLYNIIGDNFKLNNINSVFQYNTIGINFINNNIRSNFYLNQIGNYFIANQINDDFEDNIILNFCTNNVFNNKSLILDIDDNFRNNKIDTAITNSNFFGATHVYNEYNTTIFKNSTNTYRLSYYGGSDQLIVTDIDA